MSRAVRLTLLTATLAGLAGLAAASVAAPASAAPAGAAPASDPIPIGVVPSSTSWNSARAGWVLGFAPCGARQCPVLLHTRDGGRTWQRRPAPPVQLPPTQERVRVHFADARDGWVTDGHLLYATHDGGAHWAQASPAPGPVLIGELASGSRDVYAIVGTGADATARTSLYRSPVHRDAWAPVPGVSVPVAALPASGGWDVTASGNRAAVSLGAIFESSRYWTLSGRRWTERPAPCSVDAATRLDLPARDEVAAMCSYDPGFGSMAKDMYTSTRGRPFVARGPAPSTGITTDFAAASRSTAVVAAVRLNGTFLHTTFDGGATWSTPVTLSPDRPVSDLSFQDGRHGVFVWGGPTGTGGALMRTTDGGRTWEEVAI